MPEFVAPRAGAKFQYTDAEHQSSTAISAMWLVIASELLFFGPLFFLWVLLRRWHPSGFHAAAQDTDILIGSINTAIIITTSMVYFWGVLEGKAGRNRQLMFSALATGGLGLVFIALKLLEWSIDLGEGKWPGQAFVAHGADTGGQHLFWLLYYAGTGLHVIHMTIGVGLVSWIAWRARRQDFSAVYHTPVVAVGLYWSFVDIVWLNLYPFIYVLDR